MSRLTVGILSALALSLISGAAQFALGRDLAIVSHAGAQTGQSQTDQAEASQLQPALSTGRSVNRASKSDRAAGYPGAGLRTRTVSLRLEDFSDTSFLFRIPAVEGRSSPLTTKPGPRKPMVACEELVSVLTEVARQLPPGRCVT